jgi:MFS family permease
LFQLKFLPAYFLTFVNVLGFTILIPVLPFIVEQYGAPKYVYGVLLSLYSLFQFIGAPYLGSLSDSVGRKPILVISQIGTLLSWGIFGIAYFLPSTPIFTFALPLWIIAISRILDGITGGNVSVTNAYVSDITTQKEKSHIFGYLGGIAGLGIIVGPGLGGFTASGSLGYLGPILIAGLISLVTVFIIMFFLKESLNPASKQKKQKFNLKDTLLISRRIKKLNPKQIIKKVFLLRVIMSITMASYIGSIALFVIDLFHFDEKEMGLFMLGVGLFLSFNQALVYKKVVAKIGEIKTLAIGFILMSFGFISITLTNNLPLYIFLYFFLNMGFSLVIPVFNSLIAQKGDKDKQGEAMGISESIRSLSNAICPILAAYLYSVMGFSFYYILAVTPLVGVYICYRIIYPKQHEN